MRTSDDPGDPASADRPPTGDYWVTVGAVRPPEPEPPEPESPGPATSGRASLPRPTAAGIGLAMAGATLSGVSCFLPWWRESATFTFSQLTIDLQAYRYKGGIAVLALSGLVYTLAVAAVFARARGGLGLAILVAGAASTLLVVLAIVDRTRFIGPADLPVQRAAGISMALVGGLAAWAGGFMIAVGPGGGRSRRPAGDDRRSEPRRTS